MLFNRNPRLCRTQLARLARRRRVRFTQYETIVAYPEFFILSLFVLSPGAPGSKEFVVNYQQCKPAAAGKSVSYSVLALAFVAKQPWSSLKDGANLVLSVVEWIICGNLQDAEHKRPFRAVAKANLGALCGSN